MKTHFIILTLVLIQLSHSAQSTWKSTSNFPERTKSHLPEGRYADRATAFQAGRPAATTTISLCLQDSVFYYLKDSADQWQIDYKSFNFYDANGNLTAQRYQLWNGSVWVDTNQVVCTYNTNNNLLTQLFRYRKKGC